MPDDEVTVHTWDTTHNVMREGPDRVLALIADTSEALCTKPSPIWLFGASRGPEIWSTAPPKIQR